MGKELVSKNSCSIRVPMCCHKSYPGPDVGFVVAEVTSRILRYIESLEYRETYTPVFRAFCFMLSSFRTYHAFLSNSLYN